MYCWPTTVIQELSVHNIARLRGHTLEGKLLKMQGPMEVAQITLELARKKKKKKKNGTIRKKEYIQ